MLSSEQIYASNALSLLRSLSGSFTVYDEAHVQLAIADAQAAALTSIEALRAIDQNDIRHARAQMRSWFMSHSIYQAHLRMLASYHTTRLNHVLHLIDEQGTLLDTDLEVLAPHERDFAQRLCDLRATYFVASDLKHNPVRLLTSARAEVLVTDDMEARLTATGSVIELPIGSYHSLGIDDVQPLLTEKKAEIMHE